MSRPACLAHLEGSCLCGLYDFVSELPQVLVLGGGTGVIAGLALRWPSVSQVVVVEAQKMDVWR